MRYFLLTFLFHLSSLPLHADKQAIAHCLQTLETAGEHEKSEIFKNLSLAYCKDQEHEKAFKTFLEALELNVSNPQTTECSDGKEALKIYLGQRESSTAIAKNIIECFMPRYLQNKEDYLLGMVLGLAFANLNQYEHFFTLFYRSYVLAPDHFLKYKTKAILNIKLFDRARTVEEKEKYRLKIVLNLNKALELFSEDLSLYRLIILFSDKGNKSNLVEALLNKIIDHNIVMPRTDISFYIKEALGVKKNELAERFIEKAASWYPASRIIETEREKLKEDNGN